MEAAHFRLWNICTDFVSVVCKDRDTSHGVAHMYTVTERALFILFSDWCGPSISKWRSVLTARVILIAMLHDVNDHKYDVDGALGGRVEKFLKEKILGDEAVMELLSSPTNEVVTRQGEDDANGSSFPLFLINYADINDSPKNPCGVDDGVTSIGIMECISAISYSAEKKRGQRWFAESKTSCGGAAWVLVRDVVSDADKLEALGESGLLRCWHYSVESRTISATTKSHSQQQQKNSDGEYTLEDEEKGVCSPAIVSSVLHDVVAHSEEKLLRLVEYFMVTRTGKHVGSQKHKELVTVLEGWVHRGGPGQNH